ncbi:unnamed protein product, partial [Clonostachys rhizophaga]
MADLVLRSEVEETLNEYQEPVKDAGPIRHLSPGRPRRLASDQLVMGECPEDIWAMTSGNPPGKSPLSQDLAGAQVGVYKTYAVNKIAPVRLAQISIEYWLRPEHRELQGGIVWVTSMAGDIRGLLHPFYYSSQAAVTPILHA